jgi:hypothetical protein
VVRNGRANQLQRFKCRACGVTFNALTGTSLARLRYRDRWLGQAEAMADRLSVCKAADRLGVLAEDAVLCTDGCSALGRAALDLGVAHEAMPARWDSRTRGPWHVQNVNAHHSRFKGWVRRCNGISSRYLTNYLGWFLALDRNSRAKAPPSALRAMAIDI